ncbi:MAG: hypothetical protein ACTHMG_00745 [Sphingomonas sp.]
MTGKEAAEKALQAMDEVLAKRPEKDGHLLSQATMCLSEYRETLAPDDWASAPRDVQERLARLNSIISVVMGLHFPVGSPPWDEFAKARDWLKGLIDDVAAADGAGAGA